MTALDSVTTLHTVIAAIREATVGSKPMLADLPAALVEWMNTAVDAEREACALASAHYGSGDALSGPFRKHRGRIAAAIRARKGGAE